MEKSNNYVSLCGSLAGRPVYSHMSKNDKFYVFPLDVVRLSGTTDTINVILRENAAQALEPEEKQAVYVKGELRSFNNKSGEGSKLIITVFAKEIGFTDEENSNFVELQGVICKKPVLRITPMGREICDIMLAVNRKYGRSDYLPCIAWGSCAKMAEELNVGDSVSITGRVQSRRYIKVTEEKSEEHTAYEVSVTELRKNNNDKDSV